MTAIDREAETRTVPLSAVLALYRDGDERGWEAEFAFLRSERRPHLDMLMTSIQETGIRRPILLGPDGRVWDGHHRLAAADELGIESVPVQFAALVPEPPTDDTAALIAELRLKKGLRPIDEPARYIEDLLNRAADALTDALRRPRPLDREQIAEAIHYGLRRDDFGVANEEERDEVLTAADAVIAVIQEGASDD